MKRVYGTPGTARDGKGRSSVLLGDDCADRVQWVSNQHEAAGKSFKVTDGYRPRGIPSDYDIDDETKTSTGGFNQYYARGQHFRRGAPYAAPPGNSDHELTGDGEGAIDCDVAELQFRRDQMRAVGMIQTDSAETWHFAIRFPPASWWDRSKVTYPNQGGATPAKPATPTTPLHVREDTMRLYQQNDTKDGKVFAFDGGAVWIGPDELRDIADANRRSGITGPGFTEPLPMPSAQITRLSETARKANGTYLVRDRIVEVLRQIAAKLGVKID